MFHIYIYDISRLRVKKPTDIFSNEVLKVVFSGLILSFLSIAKFSQVKSKSNGVMAHDHVGKTHILYFVNC